MIVESCKVPLKFEGYWGLRKFTLKSTNIGTPGKNEQNGLWKNYFLCILLVLVGKEVIVYSCDTHLEPKVMTEINYFTLKWSCIADEVAVVNDWKNDGKNKLNSSPATYSSWACWPAKCFRCERRWGTATEWMRRETQKGTGYETSSFQRDLGRVCVRQPVFVRLLKSTIVMQNAKPTNSKRFCRPTQLMQRA